MKKLKGKILQFIKSTPWLVLSLTTVMILIGGVAGNVLYSFFISLRYNLSFWLQAMVVFIFFLFIVWLYHLRNTFFPFRTLSKHFCEPHQGLIILLSDTNIPVTINSFPVPIKNESNQQAELKGTSLEEDINALNMLTKPRWNWQQLLRGLTPHQKTLRIAYLIGSKDTKDESGKLIKKGSYNDINSAARFLRQYFPQTEIKELEKAIDFEDLDEIVKYVNEGIAYIRKMDIEEKDIIIDVTGGMKTTSIAGAVVTMNKKAITFQYVQTIPPYKTIAYDLIVLPGIPEGD